MGEIGLLCIKKDEHDAKITADSDNHDIVAVRAVAELQYENNHCRH